MIKYVSAQFHRREECYAAGDYEDNNRCGNRRTEEEKLTVKAMDVATAEIGHLRDRATSMESEVTSMIISELVG